MNEQVTSILGNGLPSAAPRQQRMLLLGLALLAIGSLSVRGVTLISDDRNVSVSLQVPAGHAHHSNSHHSDRPTTRFADGHIGTSGSIGWEAINGWTPASTYGSVRQDSVLTPDQIGMNCLLFVSVGGDPYGVHCPTGTSGTAWARSVFDVQFSIATRTQYTYLFDFDPSSTLLNASLLLISESAGSQQLARTFGSPCDGILDPGVYRLHYDFSSRASGAQSGYNSSSVLFNFSPSPVPEPSAFAVLIVGAVVVGMRARQSRRQQH